MMWKLWKSAVLTLLWCFIVFYPILPTVEVDNSKLIKTIVQRIFFKELMAQTYANII